MPSLAGHLPPGMLAPPSKAGIMGGFPFQALTWILGIRITVLFHAEKVDALTAEISSYPTVQFYINNFSLCFNCNILCLNVVYNQMHVLCGTSEHPLSLQTTKNSYHFNVLHKNSIFSCE